MELLISLGNVMTRKRVQEEATPVVAHAIMTLNGSTTMVAVTASATVISSNRDILIAFVSASLLVFILGSIGRRLIVVVPAPLVVLVLVSVV